MKYIVNIIKKTGICMAMLAVLFCMAGCSDDSRNEAAINDNEVIADTEHENDEDESVVEKNTSEESITDELADGGYILPVEEIPEDGIILVCDKMAPGGMVTVKKYGKAASGKTNWYKNLAFLSVTDDVYELSESDFEKVLKVKVTTEDKEVYTKEMYIGTIPAIFINTGKGKIGDEPIQAQMYMNGCESMRLTEGEFYTGDITIKLRGNSTKYREKSPYKIKLEKKTDMFGMGSSKHWVLLAEDIDHTLSRNYLTLKLARDIGIDTASNAMSVSVIVNGNYKGVYTLCEHIRIGKDQIDVFDWEKLAEDVAKKVTSKKVADGVFEDKSAEAKTYRSELEDALLDDMSWISEPYIINFKNESFCAVDYEEIPNRNGGVLLEMDFYHKGASPESVATGYLQPLYINSPESIITNEELMENMRKYMCSFEYALHSRDFIYHNTGTELTPIKGFYDSEKGWRAEFKSVEYSDPEHEGWHYSDFIDMDSLVNNFIICEFTRNWDGMKNSMFVYKDVDQKAYLAPVWDFDWAYGNINMYGIPTYIIDGWATLDNTYIGEQFYQQFNWNRYLIRDEEFVKALYEKWNEIRPTVIEELICEGGGLDQRRAELAASGKANDKKWSSTYRYYGSLQYEASWNLMTNYIRSRVKWMDEQFESLDTLYASLNP